MAPTRKTHIVRVYDDSSGTKDKDVFVDIEVLDAVAFRTENNREVILSLPAAEADPVIKDDVGVGAEKSPNNGTRLSHMKKVTSKDGKSFFAAEILDCVAFRDANNAEWILQMPGDDAAPFNTTTGEGSGDKSTRRTHTEKLSATPGEKDPTNYISVERCDEMAFRSFNGQELIIKMPSSDDKSGDGRAESVTTPDGYDGTDDGATPPENTDPNVYFKFMKGSGGVFLNDDDKAAMGPLWWLRRASGGEILVLQIDIARTNLAPPHVAPPSQDGGTPIGSGGPAFKLTTSFGVESQNIEGDLTTEIDGLKTMPRTPNDTVPAIKLNQDSVWWTDHPNTDDAVSFTSLLFFNVAKLKKDSGKKFLNFKLEFPQLKLPDDSIPTQGIGHYIWVYSSDNLFVFVALHPPPDKTNAFGPYPFDDISGNKPANYISLWNNSSYTDNIAFSILNPSLKASFSHVNFFPTDFPGSNGALGFKTAAGAAAWAEALIASEADDIARAIALNASLGLDIHGGLTNPLGWGTFDIDFSNPSGPPPNSPQATVTITAMDFFGKRTFDYSELNQPQFIQPNDPNKKLTQTFGHTADFAGSVIDITIDEARHLSMSETEN